MSIGAPNKFVEIDGNFVCIILIYGPGIGRHRWQWTTPGIFTVAMLTGLAPVHFLAVANWVLVGTFATGIALRQEDIMRSKWIEHKGKKIFYQDFSRQFYDVTAVKTELDEVQKIVIAQPKNSVLVLSDFRDTSVGSDLLASMNAASNATKDYVHKTAVLGVTGMKQKLADLLTVLTGQPLKYFDDIEEAKDWLVQE